MARSIFMGIKPSKDKPVDRILDADEIDPIAGIAFSVSTVAVIYSYLALEAFTNYHLYKIWKDSRKFHAIINNLKQADPKQVENLAPTYDSFYQKYGRHDKFEDLRSTDLRNLNKRIKTICEEFKIPKVHEVNNELWMKFTVIP